MSSDAGPRFPFNDPTADLILRSVNSIDFRVHKFLLSLASPVFRDMLSLPQDAEDTAGPEASVVELQEDSLTLEHLLSWCDPRASATSGLTLSTICLVLEAASKYQMDAIGSRVISTLLPHVPQDPLRVYAIASRYHSSSADPCALEVMKTSAKELLKHSIPFTTNSVKELETTPASYLHHLYQYHTSCGKIARDIASTSVWTTPAMRPWEICNCGSVSKSMRFYRAPTVVAHSVSMQFEVSDWWVLYMHFMGQALQTRPHPRTVLLQDFDAGLPLRKAQECECSPADNVYAAIQEYNKVLAAEIEKAVGLMELTVK